MLLKLPVLHNTEGNMNDCQPLKETGSVFQKTLSSLASHLFKTSSCASKSTVFL